ncbi:hypothetical protein [Streptomyces sp. NPDC048606]|uniref:hypothetical protein n=1 Tax=Streptomyces sp. NPDC048606 TaxID=3154726 RepID=UPI003423AA5F
MRLRNASVAALGALTLLLAVPSSASAAAGNFEYTYGFDSGTGGVLLDPSSGECINIPEATEVDAARAPKNYTDATATLFLGPDCEDTDWIVMEPGKVLGSATIFRSVVFN